MSLMQDNRWWKGHVGGVGGASESASRAAFAKTIGRRKDRLGLLFTAAAAIYFLKMVRVGKRKCFTVFAKPSIRGRKGHTEPTGQN